MSDRTDTLEQRGARPPSQRQAALAGARDLSPIMIGMAPFGLVAGIAAIEAGLPGWGASLFSTVVFAGASQVAALDLIGQGATPAVVVGTIAIINARFVMYSASLATRFGDEPMWRRVVMSYLMTDQAYAVTITKLEAEPDYGPRWAYFVGGALSLWAAWQLYTVVGVLAGAVVPEEIPLGFAIPLVFLALLVPAVSDRPTLAAALTSALVAVVGGGLPFNLGLLAAAGSGIAVGYLVSSTAAPSPAGAAHDRASDGDLADDQLHVTDEREQAQDEQARDEQGER